MTENSFYSLDMTGMDTKQHIIRESKQTIYFFYVNLLLISLTSALHIVKNGNEPEQFLFIKYSEETFSSQASSINFLFYVLYFIMCLYFVNELYTLVYLTQQLKFQFYILNDCISCMLGKRYKFQCELELPHNEIYQKKVFKRLKFCIKYHEMLMRWVHIYFKCYLENSYLSITIFFFSVMGKQWSQLVMAFLYFTYQYFMYFGLVL